MNLRPLWSPAAGALATLAQRFGDVVWGLVFAELQGVGEGREVRDDGMSLEEWVKSKRDGGADDPWEEEKSWRDPSAHSVRSVVVKWMGGRLALTDLIEVNIAIITFGILLLTNLFFA